MKLTGAQIITEVLIEQGVDTVFGYPGGTVLNTYDALYEKRDVIKHYITAHEQGASHAADGYARATGKTGVVMATSGPGATNLVTGIATAFLDSVPMVAITGNVGTPLLGKDSFQEVYIVGITSHITKHNFIVHRVEELADTIRLAFKIAQSGRKGPVLVDVPKDLTAAVCEYEPKSPLVPDTAPDVSAAKLVDVADAINESKRPFLLIGGGVPASGAEAVLRALVEAADIPIAHTLMAAGVLAYNDARNTGLLGMHGSVAANRACDSADLLVAVGTRFSDRVALNTNKFARSAKIVQIDIDSCEIQKNVHVDMGVVGDVKQVLETLLPMIQKNSHAEWFEQIAEWRKLGFKPVTDFEKLRPYGILKTVNDLVENPIIVTDVGQHQMWAAQYCGHTDSRGFLTSGGLGTMGYGYGAAIGAKVARPDRTVIHITGDGSFHMNMNEACTAASFGIKVITVIMNNHVLGMVRQWQNKFYNKHFYATTLDRLTDYVKVAEGFGLKGYVANTPAEFEAAMKSALLDDCAVWIDCRIDRDEMVLPMIPGGAGVEDIILE